MTQQALKYWKLSFKTEEVNIVNNLFKVNFKVMLFW